MIPPIGTSLCRACREPITGRESTYFVIVGGKRFRVCADCADARKKEVES